MSAVILRLTCIHHMTVMSWFLSTHQNPQLCPTSYIYLALCSEPAAKVLRNAGLEHRENILCRIQYSISVFMLLLTTLDFRDMNNKRESDAVKWDIVLIFQQGKCYLQGVQILYLDV